jgi:DNA-binding beta-propeller fold protein YncE
MGENPFSVAISPDGRFAVAANYVGKPLENGSKSSTLVVIDMDRTSDTYLEPLTWISNR